MQPLFEHGLPYSLKLNKMFTISSMKEYVEFSKEHCDWLILTLPVDDAASPFT